MCLLRAFAPVEDWAMGSNAMLCSIYKKRIFRLQGTCRPHSCPPKGDDLPSFLPRFYAGLCFAPQDNGDKEN